ncbi:Acetylornithine deacetylase [[Actinomadura] parvosata subsp. kistnae]|uniref:M20 family metallopeptidase n=1 Tax=[Actinomadura] parvosata TaxID=1955412 RepID=UPI000D2DBEE5|nr:M20/M25/M40 family metallo-hydrolase [Nonomuraea sp. ATCC 55076]SPL89474.1 Acetylornithine deacetylase [Actinomadura parvosata subsp. kistnae]
MDDTVGDAGGGPVDPVRAAHQDHDSVVELTRELVRVPSRGGIDAYEPVLDHMAGWLAAHGLPCAHLAGPGGGVVALVCEVAGDAPGPCYVLDACLDTAPFGDDAAWAYPPTSGRIHDGWLHGRGSSDSKAGAAIFAHIAARLHRAARTWRGSVVLLFDIDEHTGGFGGAKAFFEREDAPHRVDGVMIGYPGLDHVVTGGRGVLRARVQVHGIAAHSGGSRAAPSAIHKAAEATSRLHRAPLPGPGGPGFPLPPKLTVTAIHGGEGYSTIPDLCILHVDIRLTPAFEAEQALALLRSTLAGLDADWPDTPPTNLTVTTRWPAFALPEHEPLRAALLAAAQATGLHPQAKVAGPSNIGNYLAGLNIPAIAGFGVDYRGLHATDEQIRLDSIPPVQATYHRALLSLLPAC